MIIVGSDGFIGRHFCLAHPEALRVGRDDLDLLSPKISFSTNGYSHALITAGVGNPRKCMENPSYSRQCNVAGTLELAKMLQQRHIEPVLFSSDYVFNNELLREPLNEYGKQKLELENEAAALGLLVIRLSKVYGVERGDGTLFDEMASKLVQGSAVKAAKDQVFSPIFVGDVVAQVELLLKQKTKGIVNVAGPSYASRLEMAEFLAEKMGAHKRLIKAISLDELDDGVARPKFLKVTSSLPARSWQEGIEQMVAAYGK